MFNMTEEDKDKLKALNWDMKKIRAASKAIGEIYQKHADPSLLHEEQSEELQQLAKANSIINSIYNEKAKAHTNIKASYPTKVKTYY